MSVTTTKFSELTENKYWNQPGEVRLEKEPLTKPEKFPRGVTTITFSVFRKVVIYRFRFLLFIQELRYLKTSCFCSTLLH